MAVSDLAYLRIGSPLSREQLFTGIADGNLAALELHLATAGDVDAKDEDGMALIHYAACHGNIPLIRKLWEYGADINLLDGSSPPWKPIHYAIFHRKHEAENELRKLGAEVSLPILKQSLSRNSTSQQSTEWSAQVATAPTPWRGR